MTLPFLFNGNNIPAPFLYIANIIMDIFEQHVVFRYVKYCESKTWVASPGLQMEDSLSTGKWK